MRVSSRRAAACAAALPAGMLKFSAARQSAAASTRLAGFGQAASLIAACRSSTEARFCANTCAASSSESTRDQHAFVRRMHNTFVALAAARRQHQRLAQPDLSDRPVVYFRVLISLLDPLISRKCSSGNISFPTLLPRHKRPHTPLTRLDTHTPAVPQNTQGMCTAGGWREHTRHI